jgi:16S rRNA (cytosine967-C5)-methyltransferase
MRPASLLGHALECIQILDAPGRLPADARLGRYFRERRYLGSRDRRFLGDAAHAWLRHLPRVRARWTAWVAAERQAERDPGTGEGAAVHLADLLTLARDGLFPWTFAATLAAARELPPPQAGPGAWSESWVAQGGWPASPLELQAAEMSLPPWLAERLIAECGEGAARRLAAALLEQAPVDLRVNLRRASREVARAQLATETGLEVELTPLSPLGLRLRQRRALGGTTAVRDGWVEVEDEGSQLAVLCLDVRPGEVVIDACAGAGGKSLALADLLGADREAPASRLIACDVDGKRLAELERRAAVAGVAGAIERVTIAPTGPLPGLPAGDLVLVDTPCSGLGTLRRSPELKLRHDPAAIDAFAALQRSILERFAPLVRPGGRLAYVTCSLLAAENELVARCFTAAHAELLPTGSSWARKHLPAACLEGPYVRLDPVRSGTDCFFIALWQRGS